MNRRGKYENNAVNLAVRTKRLYVNETQACFVYTQDKLRISETGNIRLYYILRANAVVVRNNALGILIHDMKQGGLFADYKRD